MVAIMNEMDDTVKLLIEKGADFINEAVQNTAIEYNRRDILRHIRQKICEKENWQNRKLLLKAWKSNTPLSKLNEFLFARVAMFA